LGETKPIPALKWALAGVIVAIVIVAVLTCTAGIGRGMELWKIIKHVLATLAALLAVIGSIL
jgi:choline-glycine betaine transporter